MPTRELLTQLRMKNKVTGTDEQDDQSYSNMSMQECIKKCQDFLNVNGSAALRSETDLARKDNLYRNLINEFVDRKIPRVIGYYGREGGLADLKIALYNANVGYGQLTDLMAPADREDSPGKGIDEIRINSRDNIWFEKNGIAQRADSISLSEEEIEIIKTRLIEVSKQMLTPGNPIVNARTKEGYRVNIVHKKISSMNDYVAVIRKFNSTPRKARDLIGTRTFSIDMYKMMKLIVDSDSSYVVIGATGSGKTVTNGIILRNIRNNSRIISIENPVELPLKKYNSAGQVINDVVQYEAVTKASSDDKNLAAVENMIDTAMRQSPHWLILGEGRTPEEFVAALTAGQTGHCFATTFHAESASDALRRYLTAYMKVSKEPANLAMANICSTLRFIISQQKLPDGSRKIVEIAEVFPPKSLDSVEPQIRNIYEWQTEEIVYDERYPGQFIVKEMKGKHVRVNKLDERNVKRWINKGVSKDRFSFLLDNADPSVEQRYDVREEDAIND